ncbi:MAG: glycosyl hydrolase family 8, partial [Candidatus Dormibacteria bacterium]
MEHVRPGAVQAGRLRLQRCPAASKRQLPGPLLGLVVIAALTCTLAVGCGSRPSSASDSLHTSATSFLSAYVASSGAVIRRGQGGDVVSEGQAYGMLIAELAGSATEVRRIWGWTSAHLLQPDGLLAYHATAQGVLLSHQSATDADTLAAYALLHYRGAV